MMLHATDPKLELNSAITMVSENTTVDTAKMPVSDAHNVSELQQYKQNWSSPH